MRKFLVPAAIGAALLVGAGGVAYASIPSSTGVITGCVNKVNGQVRIIDTAKTSCNTNTEQTLPWNQAGQPGTPGTNGTNGTNGTDGVSGYSYAFTDVGWSASAHPPTSTVTFDVECPPGTKVIGGFSQALLLGFSGSGPVAPQQWYVVQNENRIARFVFMDPVTRSNFTAGQQLAGQVAATCAAVS